MRVMEIEPQSSGKATNALNEWAILPASELNFLRNVYSTEKSNLTLKVLLQT